VQQGVEGLKEGSPYRFIAESGLEATGKHVGLLGNVALNEWISMSIQRAIDNVQARTQDGLAFLATVGSTAPFVGLFGTVWGIYHALTAIGIAGQASIDKVAGPVGEAADHDGVRSRGRSSGGARLQLAHPPQQGRDGQRPRLRRRTCTRCC
jgi:biopolymer transport protein ExbB